MDHILSEIYSKLPVSLQNVAFSVLGARLKHQRYGSEFHRILSWLKETEWWTEIQIDDYQDRKLQETIKHAYETIPFYREKMREKGLKPIDIRSKEDLRKIPILSKQEVRENFEKIISSAYKKRKLRKLLTSGTSGTPLRIYLTSEAEQFRWAVIWRHKARFGLKLGDRFLMFGARLPIPIETKNPPFWRYDWSLRRAYLSTYHLTPNTMPAVIDWLNEESFAYYTGYPSAMYVLANFIRTNGYELKRPPKCIVSASDALLPIFERTIMEVFKAPVTDYYGSGEACGWFSRCEHDKYHLDPEIGIVELIPIAGMDNPRLRRFVCTSLTNPAMPFIRYEIGDYGLVSEQPCICGRKTLTLDRIEGRTEDFVRTPDGRMAIGMNQVFEWAPGILEAQIQQEVLHEIIVLVVPAPEYSQSDQDMLESELRKRLGNSIGIKFKQVNHIPRSKSGKFRAVVSKLQAATREEKALQKAVENGIF